MSDYYYENDIVPPDIHFRMPSWLKNEKPDIAKKKIKSDTKVSKKQHNKLITPPNSPTSLNPPPIKYNDSILIAKEHQRAYPRFENDRNRKRRSLGTSFSGMSEDIREVNEALSYFEQHPKQLSLNHRTDSTSKDILSSSFYNPSYSEGEECQTLKNYMFVNIKTLKSYKF